jgi:beta-glucosidase-like glycosyl hydrolase
VIQGELRGRLGYQGVTVTDAIEAGALNSGQLDPTAFNTAVQRVTALRDGMH